MFDMKTWFLPSLLAAPVAALLSMMAAATLAAEHDEVRNAVTAGRFRPLAEILQTVQRKHTGNVLDVELDRNDKGHHVYEVRLLEESGRRREIHIDAVTGEEVRRETGPLLADLPNLLRKVLEQYPGRVVDVDLERGRQGREIYHVWVLQENGQVRGLFVDASTGELISDIGVFVPTPGMKQLPDLLESLLRRYSGTVLEVELKYDRDEQPVYEIDLRLPNDSLIELTLDPVTGRVLSEEEIEVR